MKRDAIPIKESVKGQRDQVVICPQCSQLSPFYSQSKGRAKNVETCRKYFDTFDVAPFRWPLLRSTEGVASDICSDRSCCPWADGERKQKEHQPLNLVRSIFRGGDSKLPTLNLGAGKPRGFPKPHVCN